MKATERYASIEEIVNREGSISVAALKRYFPHISDMTLRRDLDYLDKASRIIRVHGGVRSIQATIGTEASYLLRNTLHVENKQEIARKAVELLHPNTCIFVDSGSTTTALCKIIPQEHFLIYTSGLLCAQELTRLQKSELYILGGQLNCASLSTNGLFALSSIENIHFDLALIGSTGFTPECGFTSGNFEDARLKSEVIKRANKRVILMDSTKVGRVSTFTFAFPDVIDVVVTDGNLDAATKEHFKKHNTEIL